MPQSLRNKGYFWSSGFQALFAFSISSYPTDFKQLMDEKDNNSSNKLLIEDDASCSKFPAVTKKRFCWGRLTKLQFILLIAFITIVFVFLAALAISYIFIIPGILIP